MNKPAQKTLDIEIPTINERPIPPQQSVAVRHEQPIASAPQAGSPAALLSVIADAVRDPSVDVNKMEKLMALYERMEQRGAEQLFNDAMMGAQKEIRPVATDASNPQTRSRYASYAALDRALRPIYTRHGFALTFNTEEGAAADCVRVVCHVSCGGFTRKYQVDMPADGKGAKGGDVMTKTHAAGSAFSYGMRYLLKMIFNIAVGDGLDDDGNLAGSGDKITASQAEAIKGLIAEVGADIPRFLDYMTKVAKIEVGRVEDIPAKQYDTAVGALERKVSGAKPK